LPSCNMVMVWQLVCVYPYLVTVCFVTVGLMRSRQRAGGSVQAAETVDGVTCVTLNGVYVPGGRHPKAGWGL